MKKKETCSPIIVFGKSGQLARSLQDIDRDVVCLGRDDIDLLDSNDVSDLLRRVEPGGVINAAAYTNVDGAEQDCDAAYDLNVNAVANIAKACTETDCHLVHVSTDYVFSGDNDSPYTLSTPCNPINVYGTTKLQGEMAVREFSPQNSAIIRTSWVYSQYGNNFVKTMLRLMSQRPDLSVVDDQIGSPTSAFRLAHACLYALKHKISGTHHYADAGCCSWFEFAVCIQEIGLKKGLLQNAVPILPISSDQFPTKARRPRYSVLDTSDLANTFSGLTVRPWTEELEWVLDKLAIQNKTGLI